MSMCVAATVAAASVAFAAERSKGGGGGKPPPVHVAADGKQVRAAQGTFCYSSKMHGLCADYAYPLQVKARLPVAVGARVAIDAGTRVRRLTATLIRVTCERPFCDGIDEVAAVKTWRTGEGRHWRAKLPLDLQGANVLSVDIRFRGARGDSNVWAGLEQASPRIPSLRASKSTG